MRYYCGADDEQDASKGSIRISSTNGFESVRRPVPRPARCVSRRTGRVLEAVQVGIVLKPWQLHCVIVVSKTSQYDAFDRLREIERASLSRHCFWRRQAP